MRARPISKRAATYRLRKVAASLSDADWEIGRAWYPAARQLTRDMEAETGHPSVNAAAVIAHLSPRTRWDKNVDGAWQTLRTGEAPLGWPHMRRWLAWAALQSRTPLDTLEGPKTTAFGHNLVGSDDAVTIDAWMLRAFNVTEVEAKRVGQYDVLADIVRKVAAEHDVAPAVLQAAVWCHIRGAAT